MRPLSVIFAFWILMDLVLAISYSLTFRWAVLGKVDSGGTYCTAQGQFSGTINHLKFSNTPWPSSYRSTAAYWGCWYFYFSVSSGALGRCSISSH